MNGSRQFGRSYVLRIGNKKESIEIRDLRISFSCVKSLTAEPNPAELNIYNLNESSRNRITSGEFNQVFLMVGYGNELGLVFAGDIINPVMRKDDTDWITSLECGDGHKEMNNARTNVTIKGGTGQKDVINILKKDMGKDQKSGIVSVNNSNALPRSKTMIGKTSKYVTNIARNNNADWSIQDGELVMLPKDEAIDDKSGFILAQDTGMIGSPEKSDSGIEVTCLLNTNIRPGSLIHIESIIKEYSGDFKVTDVEITGDSHSDEWYSHITCIGGKFQNANAKK